VATQLQELGEIHIGEWQGMSFDWLEKREDWRRFNAFRSGSRPPGGESMLEVQTRMVAQIACLRARHSDGTVAIVSHADPLRALITYFLGMPLDSMLRLEISPGSLSVVQLSDWDVRLLCLNDSEHLPV
jgi:probable phosphoglycerate mutase